ncbi:serine/threonine-protein kinase [Planctomicrobium piriforme]|nr:serine/threonine-protein kinase [Planctomicrobium piriforme]
MSELGFQHTVGSSAQGLTFVRPLPQAAHAPASEGGERSSVRRQALTLIERLFPPRAVLESGALPPVIGLELGHFVIEERIGRGGMGAVFRAIDKRLDRVVALKVLSPEHSDDPDAVQRFQNEARAAARLDHDNIARVHYIDEEARVHFIAFEFVSGTNIRTLISQKGRLSPGEAVSYTLQIAEALRHTAANNVVHRDIKPSNIIVSPSGRAKLVDLGLARNTDSRLSRELTTVGTALGTFDYIAPEQALDARNVDVRSDIYSLGCSLYHMVTGTPPYPSGTMFEKVMNHHRPVPPDPAERNALVSPQLARIVQKMMASNPDERYATPDDLMADLIPVAQSLGLEATPADSVIWSSGHFAKPKSRWEGTPTWTAVALLLLVLVFADRLRFSPRTNAVDDASPTSSLGTESRIPPTPYPLNNPETLGPSIAVSTSPPGAAVPTPVGSGLVSPGSASSGAGEGGLPPLPVAQDANTTIPTPNLRLRPPEEWWNQPLLSSLPPFSERMTSPLGNSSAPPLIEKPVGNGQSPSLTPEAANNAGSGQMVRGNTTTGTPAAALPVVIEPFLVVNPASDERFPCSTLAAAVAMAKDNWAIEIQPTASALVLQEPLTITDKRIRIRPGREYQPGRDARPLLKFDLAKQQMMGGLTRASEVIRITRGALELYDLDVEMLVDPASIVDWSMVTLLNGSRLTAHGASLTIVNPFNIAASVVSMPDDDADELADLMPDRMMTRQNVIELRDSVVRGQFDFIVQQSASPLSVTLQNSALAVSGWIFRIDGSNSFMMTMQPDAARVTSLNLDHVTAVAGHGLLKATSGEHGSMPLLKLGINSSVFRVDQPGQPLIEISGHEDDELLRQALQLEASRDRSFFQLTGPFCTVDSSTSLLSESGQEYSPQQLGLNPDDVSQNSLIVLRESLELSNWNGVQPADLELRSGDDNPAIGSSGDLQNAGVNWQTLRLPLFLGTGRSSGAISRPAR